MVFLEWGFEVGEFANTLEMPLIFDNPEPLYRLTERD
jgi:hypothetical protein